MSVQGSMAYVYGKIKGRLGALASQEIMTKLEHAPSVEAALKLLQGTSYDAVYVAWNNSGDLREAELALLEDEVAFLKSLAKTPSLAKISKALLEYYQVLQIKEALRFFFDSVMRGRGKHAQQSFTTKVLYGISWDDVHNATTLEHFASLIPRAYGSRILEHRTDIEQDKSLCSTEMALDLYYMQNLADAIKAEGGKDKARLEAYIKRFADLSNLQSAMRFSHYYKLPLHDIVPLLSPLGRAKSFFAQDTSGDPIAAFAKHLGLDTAAATGAKSKHKEEEEMQQIIAMRKDAARSLFGGSPFSPAVLVGYAQLRREESSEILRLIYTKYYETRKKQWEGGER